jgi:hydroxymethylbilane synthase
LVASRDGQQIVRDQISGPIEDAERLGTKLADRLLERGAKKLLSEERGQAPFLT